MAQINRILPSTSEELIVQGGILFIPKGAKSEHRPEGGLS